MGNTRAAMFANLIGHYPIGLVSGLLLGFGFGFGVLGIWAGLALGLVCVALLLIRSWRRNTHDLDQLRPVVLRGEERVEA